MFDKDFYSATRMQGMEVAQTMRMHARSQELIANGRSVISLSIGEPDFDTPRHIYEAAIVAMERGETRYTAPDGTSALKKAVIAKYERDYGLRFTPNQVHIGAGAKQVIFNALMASVNYGDEIIVPLPTFVSYLPQIKLVGGVPICVPCILEDGLKLTAGNLEDAITDKTRYLLLNSPGNPSGAVYLEGELRALADVLLKYPKVMILTDEVYELLVFDGLTHVPMMVVAPELADRIITVNSVSKTYCMTGWRIGYAVGPEPLIKAMAQFESHSAGNPNSIAQAAATAALLGQQEMLEPMKQTFQHRRDLVVRELGAIEGLRVSPVEGAFYTFPSMEHYLGCRTHSEVLIETDSAFCNYALEDFGVAVVPGSSFEMATHFRLSYALSKDILLEGCKRLSSAFRSLH